MTGPVWTDDAVGRLLDEIAAAGPYTWRDSLRYWWTWRPAWAVHAWRRTARSARGLTAPTPVKGSLTPTDAHSRPARDPAHEHTSSCRQAAP